MGLITVNRLKNLMKTRDFDVEVVTLPSVLGSTEYKKELFFIQGYARRGGKLKKNKNGIPEAIPMWRAKKGKHKDDTFFGHTIIPEPSVGRYIDHILRSKNRCLILNPASHLKLHDSLEDGYFTKIKSVIKLTYTKSEDPYLEIHTSIDVVPYHTEEEESDVKEYIRRKFGVTEEIGTPDPLMKNHVQIQQLISDMNNARIREPLQYTRSTVWVSPSGDSNILYDVFHDDEACVKALFNEGVFKKNCIPGKTDSADGLVAKFDKLDMFDEIYFHVKKDQ
jgi:hypothetical protein